MLAVAVLASGVGIPAAEVPDLSTRAGEDWGAFLGPTGNGRSGCTGIATPWPAAGPRVAWHVPLGEGYCAPAVARGRLVMFDRVDDRMRTRCFEAETGTPLWEVSYASDYRDTFGYDGGPRAAPVIHGDRVLTFGPEGRLECRSLADGASLWSVDTTADYHVVQNFFGVGAAPLVVRVGSDDLVVVQVGGSPPGLAPAAPDRLDLVKGLDRGLVAFDLATGRERWRCSSQLASYAAPVLAEIGGRPRILAWMRNDLLVVDPASGAVLAEFRWRADELFSAAAIRGWSAAIAIRGHDQRSWPTGRRRSCTMGTSMARAGGMPAMRSRCAWSGRPEPCSGASPASAGPAWCSSPGIS